MATVMKPVQAKFGGIIVLIVVLITHARGSIEVVLTGPLTVSGPASEPSVAINLLEELASPLPTAIDTPVSNFTTAAGRRILAACADTVSWCASWQTSGYCAPQYVYNGQSVKDVVCAKTCNGVPCSQTAGCADTMSNCASWAQQGYCAPQYVYNGKSVKDVVCPKSCNGAPCQGGSSSSSCADSSAALSSHNTYRARHGAPALQWSASLANDALAWAKNLASQGCGLKHGGYGNAGQNLYAVLRNTDMSCVSATEAWYSEVSQYMFTRTPWTSNQPNFKNIGHFTQMVWKSSTQLGCGAAKGANCYVVSCHYSPAGNMVGDSSFYANVLPRK